MIIHPIEQQTMGKQRSKSNSALCEVYPFVPIFIVLGTSTIYQTCIC
jgi:hypothetical protein